MPRREKSAVLILETLKNWILNEKFNVQMTIIRAFLSKIRARFSSFWKRAGETCPLPPLVTRLTIEAWYSLDLSITNSNSLEFFKSKLLAFIRPGQRSIYNVFNPQGLKFLTRLRLGLSHLNEHRFRHNFKDCINPLCSCSLEVENMLHFFSGLPSFNFSHGSYE